MTVVPLEALPVRLDGDLGAARRAITYHARRIGFDTLARTRLLTASSELLRNMLSYGGGGELRLDELRSAPRIGLRATFEDHGPGIADPAEALRDGVSSGRGLGLGLGGARRLVDEFELDSLPGRGTRVSIASWRAERGS